MKLVSEIRAGQKVVLPFAGEVEFDKNGVVEVENKVGEQILEAGVVNIRKHGTKTTTQTKQEEKKSAQEQAIDDAIANIKSMKSYDELHALCKDAKIPEEEWKDLKVKELKELLISKIAPKK